MSTLLGCLSSRLSPWAGSLVFITRGMQRIASAEKYLSGGWVWVYATWTGFHVALRFSSRSRGGVYDTKGSRLESQTPVCYSVFFKQWEFIGLWIFMWLLSQHTHTNEVCKITHSPWASASLFSSAVSKVAIKELFLNEGKIHQIR